MEIYKNRRGASVHHHWLLSFTILTLLVFGALAIMQSLALLLVSYLFGIPLDEIGLLIEGSLPHPQARLAFLLIQGLGGGAAFLVGGWFFIRFVDRKTIQWKHHLNTVKANSLLITIPILLGFILLNSLFIYINMNIEFPEAFSGLERVLKNKEEELMRLTLYITDFDSILELLTGILVIGILAGIGEEYLFRGIIQPKMHRYTGNRHLGIWITAVIFSAIHMQFYGFLPRMLLGALFGYLYLYSGSLVYPMVAHALNNTFTVLLVYLNKLQVVDFEIEGSRDIYWHYILIGLVIFIVSFNYFLKEHKKDPHGKMAKDL